MAIDPARAHASTNDLLADIARKCSDLAVLNVPRDHLFFPRNQLSLKETELLCHGDDLGDHLVQWYPNPFRET